jgi:predicted dehydrogenase
MIKLAVIGCGAVTEIFHLPAIALSGRMKATMLVDKSLPRALHIAEQVGAISAVDDYRKIIGKVDAAIVAVPNYLHHSVTMDLLENGIHVLVEKPMAMNSEQCEQMISTAASSGAILAVSLMRRFKYSSQFVKQVLNSRLLGEIRSFDFREGVNFGWPVASDFMFRKEYSGGGVLIDIGVHVIDLLLWWLGNYRSVDYYDDAMGGVEANSMLYLELENDISGIMELSRIRNLRNTYIIYGENGSLEVGCDLNPILHLKVKDHQNILTGQVEPGGSKDSSYVSLFRRQLHNFAEAILNHGEPFITGNEGKRSIALIEACYAASKPLILPWIQQ